MRWFGQALALYIVLWFSHGVALAAEPFDPQYANQLLDKLSIKLSIAEPTAEGLQNAANILIQQKRKADACVDEVSLQLEEIKVSLPEVSDPSVLSPDQRFFYDKKIALEKRLSECRLFSLRSQEAIQAFTESAQDLSTSKIFEKGPTIWAQLEEAPSAFIEAVNNFDIAKVKRRIGMPFIGPEHYLPLALVLMLSIALTYYIRKQSTQTLSELRVTSLPEEVLQNILATTRKHVITIVPVLSITAYFAVLGILYETMPTLLDFCFILLGYLVFIALVEFFFHPPQPASAYCNITAEYGKKFSFQLKWFGHFMLFGLTILFFLDDQDFPQVVFYLARDIIYTLITLNVFAVLFILNKMPKFLGTYKRTRSFVSFVIAIFLMMVLIAEWIGHQRFSSYLLEGVALTMLATFVAYMLNDSIQTFLSSFSEHKYQWQEKFHNFLGVKKDDSLPEMVGLKSGMFLLIWGGYIIALTNIWNTRYFWANRIWDSLTQAITIANTEVSVVPSRVILGFIVFSFGILLTRFLRALIQKKVTSKKDKAEREAYGAIFGYTGFALALILALMVAGVDLKGLALIAGALSLGIGFGLQNIVSNFVSGIILLLERPIKPGDRIAMGEDEGFVKSVNIRSTCITTLENIDIIVPNADLISNQVINQTFNNYHWRVTIRIGVAYGSDIHLVEKLLYEAAFNHPEVIKEGPDKPKVFFLEFGDSSLNFEMWCIIRNVNQKLFVLSDLNFAIDELFAKHGVEIPFPQSDIHIRDATPITITQEQKGKNHE